tara:strand:- start:20612 stop:21031 length:420 start_codon:yes stop_codon:yes gene_type:complete
MKILKISLILTIISCFTFSCSSDDSPSTEENAAKLIGTWKLTSETEDGASIQLDTCELLYTIIISSTQITSKDYYGDNCEIEDSYSITYSLKGNTITTTEDGETYNSTIITLNSTTLSIESSYEEDGETYTYTETYTKQ